MGFASTLLKLAKAKHIAICIYGERWRRSDPPNRLRYLEYMARRHSRSHCNNCLYLLVSYLHFIYFNTFMLYCSQYGTHPSCKMGTRQWDGAPNRNKTVVAEISCLTHYFCTESRMATRNDGTQICLLGVHAPKQHTMKKWRERYVTTLCSVSLSRVT